MRRPRCFIPTPLSSGSHVSAPTKTAQHLSKVLRLAVGAELLLFDGSGGEYLGIIKSIDRKSLLILVGKHLLTNNESPLKCHLLQAISKGNRMDYTLQKAVELGVQQISASFSRRSIPRLKGDRLEKKRAHWQGVIISACEQSGRTQVPELQLHNELASGLATASTDLKLLLDPTAEQTLQQLPRPQAGVTLLVGPEGGLSETERSLAKDQGFTPVQLGPRILRTETAAVTALAIMQSLWGDLCTPIATPKPTS